MLLSPYSTSTLQGAIPPPTTHWRFNQTAILPSEITFTRAGNASVFNQAGALETASTNVHRFDYNPATTALRGWLMEETRSNVLNTALTGGVAGIPGTQPTGWNTSNAPSGMQRSLEYGTENGMPYVEVRYWGTVPAGTTNVTVGFATASAIAAASGQTWSMTAFVKLHDGSLSNVQTTVSLLGTNGTSGVQEFSSSIAPTSAALSAQRYPQTGTFSSGSVTHAQPRVRFGLTAGSAVDFTVRLSWPQISQHAFATSPVAGGATRPTETALISGANFGTLFDASRGAILIDADVIGFPGGTATPPALVSLHTDINSRMQLRYSPTGQGNLRVVSGGVSVTDVNVSIPGNPLRRRGLMTWGDGMCRMYSNGILIAEAASVPSVNQVQIGGGPGSGNASAHIREMMIWRNTALTFQQAMQLSAQVF